MSNPNTAVFPNSIPDENILLVAADEASTSLTASLSPTETNSIQLASSSTFNAPCIVLIDEELIIVGAFDGNTGINLTRGAGGSTPSSHAAGAMVSNYVFAYYHNQVSAELTAIANTLGTNLSNVKNVVQQILDTTVLGSLTTSNVFQQSINTSETEFTVFHNLNTTNIAVIAYDSNNKQFGAGFQVLDTKSVRVSLSRSKLNGRIVIIGYSNPSLSTQAQSYIQSFTNITSFTFFHGLGSNVIPLVYDETNTVIQESGFHEDSTNQATFTTIEPQSGRVLVMSGLGTLSFTNQTTVTFNHNLNSLGVVWAVYDQSNNLIQPSNVTYLSPNTISVTFVDSQSGILVVSKGQAFSSTFGNALTITINHGLNTYNILPIVVDQNGAVIQYTNFQLVDASHATLTFAQPQSGTVFLVVAQTGQQSQTISTAAVYDYTQTFTNQTSVAIAHNLNSTNVIPFLFDTNGELFQYNTFQIVNENNALITFTHPQSGTVMIVDGPLSYSATFNSQTTVNITHGLQTLAILPVVVNENGYVVQYSDFQLIDDQTAVITFTQPQSGRVILIGSQAFKGARALATSQPFTNVSTVTVVHDLGTEDVVMTAYDLNNTLISSSTYTMQILDANTIQVTFGSLQSGRIVVK